MSGGTEKLSPRAKALREHRLTFEYAQAHGLTLKQAEAALVKQRWAEGQARLAQVQACGRAAPEGKNDPSILRPAQDQGQTVLGESLRPLPADAESGLCSGKHAYAPWMMWD